MKEYKLKIKANKTTRYETETSPVKESELFLAISTYLGESGYSTEVLSIEEIVKVKIQGSNHVTAYGPFVNEK